MNSTSERRSKQSTKKPQGLIIEDSVEVIQLYKTFMDLYSIPIDVADNLSDGKDLIEKNTYNFVLLDGQFPFKKEGVTERNYKKIVSIYGESMKEKHTRPLIIHITGEVESNAVATALINGDIDFLLLKPLTRFDNLFKLIELFSAKGITYGNRKSDIIHMNKSYENKIHFVSDNAKFEKVIPRKEVDSINNPKDFQYSKIFISSPIAEALVN